MPLSSGVLLPAVYNFIPSIVENVGATLVISVSLSTRIVK